MMLQLAALGLSVVAAWAVDALTAWRGLLPPGFLDLRRRLFAGASLALIFFVSVFAPALTLEAPRELDLEAIEPAYAFSLQAVLLFWLAMWYILGFVGVPGVEGRRAASLWVRQFGLWTGQIRGELAIGVVVGVAVWLFVMLAASALGGLLVLAGGKNMVSGEPPELIVWMAGLPVALRLGISLAAGVVEELFFRGFLQPRTGIAFSTMLFAGAHLAYGEPLMLFGITLLSLLYARLVVWRGSVWAAMMAHFLFDAIQLLIIIPAVLRAYESATVRSVAFLICIC